MPLNESHYFLNDIFIQGEPVPRLLKSLKQQISRNQFVSIQTEIKPVKVYTAELAYILLTKALAASIVGECKETKADGTKYFKTYVDAYIQGEKYFSENFKIETDTLYNKGGEKYIENLRQNFFVSGDSENKQGWNFVKLCFPLVLSKKEIKRFGYYSGIVSSVEALAEKHPKPFEPLKKTNQKPKSERIPAPAISLFCKLINETGIDTQKESNENFCQRICAKYKLPYSDRVRQNFSEKNLSKYEIKLQKLIYPLLDEKIKNKIQGQLDKNKAAKQKLYG